MTTKELRRLNEQCARAMGWKKHQEQGFSTYGTHDVWRDSTGHKAGSIEFSSDPAVAQRLEDEIERRGLWQEYAGALEHSVILECENLDLLDTQDRSGIAWLLIRATPEQRCRAFLAVMEARS